MTVTNDSRHTSPLAPSFFQAATGTHGSALPPARSFIGICLIASAMATGTLSIVSTADAEAMRAPVIESRTLSAFAPAPAGESSQAAVSELLQRLRRRSGLNWGEIARALSVSRRTIHNWLAGARIASVHLQNLSDLDRLVQTRTAGSGDEVRLQLLQPLAHGRSQLDDFEVAARPVQRLPISPFSVGDLLSPGETQDEPFATPVRRSTVRGGPLRKGRSAGS